MSDINRTSRQCVAAAALLGAAWPGLPDAAWGAPEDFRAELAGKPVRVVDVFELSVRVVRAGDGGPVPGAAIVPSDFNMSPEGMGHSAWLRPLPATESGVQRIAVDPLMAGRWELVVTVTVPGDPTPFDRRIAVTIPEW